MNTKVSVVAFALSFMMTVSAVAAEYFVAPTTASPAGSDDNPGTAAAPFATIAKAITELGADGGTIHLASGTYTQRGITLSAPIRVVGDGATRGEVIIDGSSAGRVFTLSNAGASLENLTVKNGKVTNADISGANVYMTAGAVTNCVVRDGQGGENKPNYGCNIYMTGGTVVDSLLIGGRNVNQGRSAVGYQIYATGGHVLRTEFKDGVWTSGSETRGSICAVALAGAVIFENCYLRNLQSYYNSTYYATSGQGALNVSSASAKVVNCTIVGNKSMSGATHCGGIYLSAAATVVNCVVYKNVGSTNTDGAAQEWGSANSASYKNCAFGSGIRAYPSDKSNVTTLTDASFADYANGDHRPAAGGALVDNGSAELYASAGATSVTDFAGAARESGAAIDIGCYERTAAAFSCLGSADGYEKLRTAAFVFSSSSVGGAGAVTYTWDFGDGSPAEQTTESSINHTYGSAGIYTVTLSASDGTQNAQYVFARPVRVAEAGESYVNVASGDDSNGNGGSEKPYRTIAHALSVQNGQSATIRLAAGTYSERNLTLGANTRVVGMGATRADVILDGGSTQPCVVNVAGEGAVLENVTVQNGRAANPSRGGNVYLTAGMVTNCVVKNGTVNKNGGGDYGCNIYMTGGTLADSVVTGGSNVDSSKVRAALGYQLYATGGHVLRTEFKDGTYTCNSGNQGTSCAVMLNGAVVFENCYLHNLASHYTPNPSGSDYGLAEGAIQVKNKDAKIVNCTIVKNKATKSTQCGGLSLRAAATVVNCVIYNNNGSFADSAALEWGNANGGNIKNCAFGAGLNAYPADESNVTTLTDNSFVDYFNNDLTPNVGSALVGAGDNAAYQSAGAVSTVDFLGQPRFSPDGGTIDIGAIERQSAGLSVVGSSTDDKLLVGGSMSFTAEAADAAGPVTFTWNFGDGSAAVSTGSASVSHTYNQVGFYTVTVFGSDGSTTTSPYTLTKRIRVAPYDYYVATTGTDDETAGRGLSAASPYRTIGYALSQLATDTSSGLAAVDGVTIHLAAGTYAECELALPAAIRLVGDGATRADVIVNGNSAGRVFTLSNAGASLENLTVKNGLYGAAGAITESGANVYMTAGMVTNCVVRDGMGNDTGWNLGANILMKDGMVVDTLLIGGGNAIAGRAAVGYQVAASGGHVQRCEFKDGTYTKTSYYGSVCPVYLYGAVVFENCYLHNLECHQCKCVDTGLYCRDWEAGHGVGYGAIFIASENAKVVNCTVVGNKADNGEAHCAGIYPAAVGTVVNCVLYKNLGSTNLDGAAQEWGNQNGGSFTYCAFGEGLDAYPSAESNVTNLTDDAFKDFAQGNCRPSTTSPLVNAGNTDVYTQIAGLSSLDLDRKTRICNRRVDIGVYETERRGLVFIVR